MTILDGSAAHDRSSALMNNEKFGHDFITLSDKAYDGSRRVESREGEYAREPIDGDELAAKTTSDVETILSDLPNVSAEFQQAVNEVMPAIKDRVGEMVKDRVKKDGRFVGNGHHVRQYIAANVQDVVGVKLGL